MGYDDRRMEVVQAAWRVIAREGLDRASMRAIARELGTSTGVVTHYFRGKDELILFALEQVFEQVLEEMQACSRQHQGMDRLEQMIFLALPLEKDDRNDWKVWLAFLGYSIGREPLIQQHQKRYETLQKILTQTLADLKAVGLLRPDLEIVFAASALIALVDGISMGVVIDAQRFSAEQQKQLVRQYLMTLQPESSADGLNG